jgi:hypothetical protein
MAVILAIAALGWWILIQQVVRGKPVGNNPMSDWGVVVIGLLMGVGFPLLLFWMHLETSVEGDRIILRMKPVSTRVIGADLIARFFARNCRTVGEYGGWGLRGFRSSRAYSMSGSQGVQLTLVDG